MTLDEIKEELNELALAVWPVGSRITCTPAPTDTDADFLVYLKKRGTDISSLGFSLAESGNHYAPEDNIFNSWRRGEVNLIASSDYQFVRRFLAATEIAKRFNLLEKSDRVLLFQAVLYGNCNQTKEMDLLGLNLS